MEQNIYKPIGFWSWNGDMNEEEVRWQIREFRRTGFGGFFMHSRAGRLISYMGEDWLAACRNAIDEAGKVGLDVWLYDEDGWPSGFAGGIVNGRGEAYCAKQLRFCEGTPHEADSTILSVYRKTEDGYKLIPTDEGMKQDLYCYYSLNRHYVDIMYQNTTEKFIEVTHEVYYKHFGEYFGKTVKGIFTDEPQMPNGMCWSHVLPSRFQEKYQVDILEDLWMLYTDGEGCQKFRYRYWSCVNELINENYVKKIHQWCEEHRILFTGHFASEDGLNSQVLSNGGVMPLYTNMGMPAIDHLGNRFANSVLMKQVTSVAHQRNLPYVLSEAFGCSGWDVSFRELFAVAGWHAVFGINRLCTHLSAYSITGRRKRDYPAFFSYQEPWWESLHFLFERVEKINQILGESKRDTRVAVLHPIRSVWCMNSTKEPWAAKFLTAQFRELLDNLLDIHIDFDLVDEHDLATSTIDYGTIKVGAIQYSMIIVPQTVTLSGETIERINSFAQDGGRVMFVNGRPQSVEGDNRHPLLDVCKHIPAVDIQNTRVMLQKYFRAYPICREFKLLDVRMENEVSGIVARYGHLADGAVIYLFNPTVGHAIDTVLCHEGNCRVEVVDLLNDSRKDITNNVGGGYTYANVTVEAHEGVLLHVTKGRDGNRERTSIQTEPLLIQTVKPLEDNSFTLDMGEFSINGSEFSSRKAILHMLDEIYARIAESDEDATVRIRYTFFAEFEQMPERMDLAVEYTDVLAISVNGQIVSEPVDWWIDKGIKKYDISQIVSNGKNEVLLTYTIPHTKECNNLQGKFESERNRFFYKIEPESIYICGDFDVRCETNITQYPKYISISNDREQASVFTLIDAGTKTKGNLTAQGMWFYRGACEYMTQLVYDGEKVCNILIDGMQCTAAKVYVDGVFAGLIIGEKEQVNLTPYLHKGVNYITVVIEGHNRNLFGPHHHIRGKLYFVGPSSFEGRRGFEDFVSPDVLSESTWTDDYSFVPFGIDGLTLIKEKISDDN